MAIDVLPLSSITVVKDAAPDDLQAFDFELTGQGSFSLIDNGDPTSAQKSFSGLIPGTYIINEFGLVGWDLTDISVTGMASTPAIDKSAGTILFDLAAGESVTVTFTNTKLCSITVIKDAIPIDLAEEYDNQTFTFSSDTLGTFTLADDGSGGLPNSTTFNNLVPGDYQIIEQYQSGWILNYINCIGAESDDLADANGTIIHLK